MVLWCFLCIHVEWYAYGCLFSLLCIFFNIVWMYDFILNVWILRERGNEFQLFLILSEKFLQGVQWNRLQGVSWQRLRVYLWKIRRDTIVLIPVEVYVRNKSHARCAQAGWKLRSYQPRGELKDCCCRKVHKVERTKYLEVFEGYHKKCVQESLEDSRLQGNLRRVSSFEINKGEMKQSHFAEVKS